MTYPLLFLEGVTKRANNYSISSGGLGEALQRSASSLEAGNNTLDESISLITAANEVVQNPEKVGNAMKTISMRIRSAKSEMEEMGEDTDGMVESTATLRDEIKALSGVDIMASATEFKSTYQILDELSQKWEGLSDIAQATIIEKMAGKHQGNIFSSLMENFDTARAALETSLNSSGSALAEHEKWQKSLEAQILSLKASWQGLSQAFLSSDFLSGAINGLTKFVDVLTKIIDTIGVIPTLLGGFGLLKLGKKGLGSLFGVEKSEADILSDIASALGILNGNAAKSTGLFGKLGSSLKGFIANAGGIGGALKGIGSALLGLVTAHPYIAAAVVAVGALTAAFTHQKKEAEELAKEVDNTVSSYKEQHGELAKLKSDYDTTNESSMISRYKELSKGVGSSNENISLTVDEYSEYQNIVGKIAEQIPSLVTGFDSQGNAILSCKNNVKALSDEYQNLIHEQNQEILANSGKIEEDFSNTIEKQSGDHWWTNGHGFWKGFDFFNLADYELKDDTVGSLSELLNAETKEQRDQILNELRSLDPNTYSAAEIRTALEDSGIEVKWYEDVYDVLEKTLDEDPQKIKGIVDNYYTQFTELVEQQKTIAQAKLSEAFDIGNAISGLDYGNIGEDLQNIAYQTVNSLDYDFFKNLKNSGKTVEQWTTEMLGQLNNIDKIDNAEIEAGFDLQTQFNGGEISYGEYVGNLRNLESTINDLDLKDEAKKQLKISLDLDENGAVDQYDKLVKRLSDSDNYDFKITENEAKSFLDGLSAEERQIAIDVIAELDENGVYETIDEIQSIVDREMVLQGLNFDLNLEVEAAGIESLNTALSESVTASGLSSDSISALKSRYADLESQGYDLSSMFEETSHGIHLNRNELSKLENELSKQKLAEVDADLNEMKAAYDELGEAIKNCDDPLKKSELYNERQSLAQKISECATLASQYKGLTSAYNDWLAAESAGNERDMYENVITGFETVKDELSRGWADDGTIKFLEMLTGRTNLAGKSGKELKEVYDGLDKKIKHTTHSVKDFFTVDKDGNSTSKGVYNFLDAVGQLEEEAFGGKDIVKRDGKGNVIGFDFELAGGDEAIAEALGVSEELVQIMVRAADDAGFVVSMDGTYKQLADLQNEAKAAADTLKELGKTDFDFDFNTSSVSNLKEQLKEAKDILKDKSFWNADGTFNFDAKGATEAMTIVSTLQAKLDTLTQEQYGIGLTVEDKEFEEPLENLQSYGKKVAALNQLELNPKANAEEIKELNGELDDIAEYFATLDTDTKVKLGFEAGDGIEEVKSKIESGEVKIPTTLDIQTNMDKNLSDLRDLALLNSGLLSEEQEKAIKIKLGIEVEEDENAGSKVQESVDEVIEGVNNGTTTVEPNVEIKPNVETYDLESDIEKGASGQKEYRIGVPVEVEPEVKEEGLWSKFKNFWNEKVRPLYGGSEPEPVEVETEVEIKPASEVKIDDNTKNEVKTGAEGRLNGMGVDVDANVNVDADVDTSKAEKKVEEKTKEAVGDGETIETTANVTVDPEVDTTVTISQIAEDIGKIESKSATINVTANLDGNIDNATGIDKIADFAEGAKLLEGVESSYVSVSANFSGNIGEIDGIDKLVEFADGAESLDGVESSNVSVTATLTANFNGGDLDSLAKFADSAKELDGVKSSDVKVAANLDSTIEGNLDDLAKFAEQAKTLQGVKSSDVSLTVELNTTFNDTNFDDLAKFADNASKLEGVKGSKVSVSANLDGNLEGKTGLLNYLAAFADGAKKLDGVKGNDISVTANLNGNLDSSSSKLSNLDKFADGAKKLQGVKGSEVSVTANLAGNLDSNVNNLATFAEGAKALQGAKSSNVTVTANIAGNLDEGSISRLNNLTSILPSLKANSSINVSVKANIDSGAINNAITVLTNLANSGVFHDYNANVTATVNYTKGEQINPDDKSAKVNYNLGTQANPKDKTVKVNYKLGSQDDPKSKTVYVNYVGVGPAAGTAHSSGSAFANGTTGRAFARGDWGIKGNGVALGGELGPEIVVRQGRWFTIGDEGAEFFRYKKNDIIFNATQSEALLKYGGIKGANPRGKMLASGTAFAGGSAFSKGTGGVIEPVNKVTGKSYSKSSSSKGDSDKSEETLDWIEIAVDRIERAIDQLDTKVNSVYRSWSERNKNLTDEISKVKEEISLQQQAYDKYMEAAAGVGLSEKYAEKVRNGEIDIETIKDETLKEKISDYQEYIEKALDAKDAILDLKETESELYAQRFQNLQTQYDGILQGYEHTEAMLNEYISQAEEQGYIVSKKYYENLVTNEKQNINALKQEQAELIAARDEAVASGKITKYSEEWYNMCNEVDSVTQAIEEGETSILSYARAMEEIDWSIFDLIQERISGITEESDFLIELLSNKKLFDDNGKLTSQGSATVALHAQNYNTQMYAADELGAEVAKLDAQIKNDPFDQELINRRNELLAQQREMILSAEESKESIKSLIEDGYDAELEALDERIQKYEEALDSQKDLFDYEKKVTKQSQNLANLRKELSSYENDTSEESKKRIQELKVSIAEAEDELTETQYDKYISDQSQLLDSLYEEYELILNQRLDNTDALLSQVIDSANANATSIQETLTSETDKVGITLSNAMNSIWSGADGSAKSVLTMYGEDFKSKSATIITTLNGIKSSVNSMVSSLNKEATTKTKANKTTTSAKKNPTASSSSSKKKTTTTTKKSSSGDGKPKIGDRVKYVSGQYYYDSQGKKPLGSHNKGEYVYITNINTRDWATHGYHISTGNKLGKGDLGWLKLNQLSGYASGKKDFLNDEVAWTQENGREFIVRPSDGAILTPIAKKGSVLNAQASNNLWNMTNSPAEFIKENLKLDASSVPSASNVNNSIVQNFENVVFSMPNVHGYNDLLREMQSDPKFEKLILSMTIDQIAGKSKLGKGKSIR